jgi:hypothetical protein
VSAKSTSTTPGDHVGIFNLAADGGRNNAALNVVSANSAFSAAEVTGHETAHGTFKISHVNPGPEPTSDANAAAISVNYVDSTGVTSLPSCRMARSSFARCQRRPREPAAA